MINLSLIVDRIKSEIVIDADGKGRASIRAVARLMDIDEKSLRFTFESAEQNPSKLAGMLIEKGFHGAELNSWSQDGIPDIAIAVIAKYYAYKAGRYCKKQAEMVDTAFTAMGVRTWLQKQVGWKSKDQQPDVSASGSSAQNPLALCQDANVLIDLIFEGTDVHPNIKAGYKANEFARIHPALAPSCENTKQLLNTPVDDRLVRPGKLAEIYESRTGVRLSAQRMNVLLESKGLQFRNPGGKNPSWLPTEQGKSHSQVILDTAKGNNKTVQSLQWHPSVIELL